MPHTIASCAVLKSLSAAKVEWDDGAQSDFHALMLRDNCFCDECFSPAVGERVKLTSSIPLDIKMRAATVADNQMTVHWDDGHVSKYGSEWLRQNAHSLSPKRAEFCSKPWDASLMKDLPRFSRGDLLANERNLIPFLSSFRDYGIALVEDVPLKKNEVERFANHLAYVREIIFDRVADIKVSADAYTQGFTSVALHPHTDCSGYRWPPNVFLFHCLANDVEGGESVYVDGQMVVDQLRKKHREHFDFLVKTPVIFRLYSKNADTTASAPTVILDEWGKLHILRYANWTVQPIQMPLEETERYYRAYHALSGLINAPENQLVIKIRPGEMMVVNNHRVLHGRRAFRAETGERHFQQVYMEADDLLGRIRNFREKGGASS